MLESARTHLTDAQNENLDADTHRIALVGRALSGWGRPRRRGGGGGMSSGAPTRCNPAPTIDLSRRLYVNRDEIVGAQCLQNRSSVGNSSLSGNLTRTREGKKLGDLWMPPS
jgi:hypothetical protein